MKGKKSKSLVAGLLAFSIAFSQLIGLVPSTAMAAETEMDGVADTWTLVNGKGNEVQETVTIDGENWLHLKAGAGNDNANNQPNFVNESAGDIQDGFFETTFYSASATAETRFGVYVRYTGVMQGVFVGYDTSGWFWQVYDGTTNAYYTGNRHPAPAPNTKTKLRIEYTDNKMTVYVDNTAIFTDVDISAVPNTGKIAVKAAAFNTQYSDMYLKDIHYTGQKAAPPQWAKDEWTNLSGKGEARIAQAEDGTWQMQLASNAENDDKSNAVLYANNTLGTFKTGSVEATLTPKGDNLENAHLGIFFRYTDNSNYGYLGYNPQSKWFWEGKVQGASTYPSIAGAPELKDGTPIKVKIEYTDTHIKIYFNDSETPAVDEAFPALSNGKSFADLPAGQLVFKVGTYGGETTAMDVTGIKYGNTSEETPEPEPEPDPDRKPVEKSWNFDDGNVSDWTALYGTPGISSVNNGENGKALGIEMPAGRHGVVATGVDKIKNAIVEADITPKEDNFRFGMIMRANAQNDMLYIGTVDASNAWIYEYFGGSDGNKWCSNNTGPKFEAGVTTHIKVKLLNDTLTLWVNGEKIFNVSIPNAPQGEGYIGFDKSRGANSYVIDNVTIKELVEPKPPVKDPIPNSLESDTMKVNIDENFPRVVNYEWKLAGDRQGETFDGQLSPIYGLKINGMTVYPEVAFKKVSDTKAVYTMTAVDPDNDIDCVITAELSVEDNILSFDITNVVNHNTVQKVNTIEVPNHSLVSVRSNQDGAVFNGSNMSNNPQKSGDVQIKVDGSFKAGNPAGYIYGFVSNDQFAAGLWSNSEASSDKRVTQTSQQGEGYVSLGLESSVWTYWQDEMPEPTEVMPSTKVVIAPDMNEDGMINWQDAAIEYRKIMNNPFGWEKVANTVNERIAMNFGGQAPNPFLKGLDNIKRVALNTDGLQQFVLEKGYANEGHDSAHPDYADIGKKIGGAEEMQMLIDEAKAYGGNIGIHVNMQESYPEANAFCEELIGNNGTGWGWLDQAYVIDKMHDLTSGNRQKRLEDLAATVQGIDMLYVDVWNQDSWESRQLAKQINDLGWRLGTEFGYKMEYNGVWTHWATDLNYGSDKGYNSQIARFIANHQKDNWIAKSGRGGAATNPLLGGVDLAGFEGWQANKDYNNYIYKTFNTQLPTKFLQHYLVTSWTQGDLIDGTNCRWDDEIKLHSMDENGLLAGDDEVVVTREGTNSRRITLNGKKVLEGESYLIPWYWPTSNGEEVVSQQKLYHWNSQGGSTTWELPDDWADVGSVMVYKLTDQGKVDGQSVDIVNGQITLKAEAATPYVVYKGEAKNMEIAWGVGTHVNDPGFNAANLDAWSGEKANASVTKSQYGDYWLEMNGETKISQTITGLEGGKSYGALIGVDNRSDAVASIEITAADGTLLGKGETAKSIAQCWSKADPYNNSGWTSYMQNLYTYFTVPEGQTSVTLTLTRAAGEGVTHMDNIRVVQTEANIGNFDKDYFKQDFENNIQGLYPFVLSSAQGTEDCMTHLSEKHAPYTQKGGWAGNGRYRYMDDVLNGDWSLKSHDFGNPQNNWRNDLVYQTIPQNFKFEPGVTYRVSFKYEMYSENAYGFVVGHGEHVKKQADYDSLHMFDTSVTEPTLFTTEVTGSEDGQTWIGIWSGDRKLTGDLGETDFVMDDLVIERIYTDVDEARNALQEAYDKAMALTETDYTADTWAVLAQARDNAKAVLDNANATLDELNNALSELRGAMGALVKQEPQVDRSGLEQAIADAQALTESDYTAESWAKLAQALEAGKTLANDATQEEVDAAAQAINDAIAALEKIPAVVDRTQLKTAIDKAKDYDLDKYVDDGDVKETFTAALDEAVAVYNNADATQADIDAAKEALLDAMGKLRLRADKGSLKEWLDKLQQYDLSKYTDESVAAVLAAKAEAEALLAQDLDNSHNDRIQQAADKLKAAIDALQRKEEAASSGGNAGGTTTTGDSAPIAAVSTLAIAAAGALLMLRKRNRNQD